MINARKVRAILLAGVLLPCVLTLPGAGLAQTSGSVNWNGWTFTYEVSGNFDGLSLKGVQFQGLPLIAKISFPVVRVFYDNNACGPFADRVGGNLAPIPWAGNATIAQREFTLNGRQWYEIGIRPQVGNYDMYQVYYLSADGIMDAHIFSKGLACVVNHVHYPNWRIDFDINDPSNDQIQLNTAAGYQTKLNEFDANATEAINHGWRVRDSVTGNFVTVLPGFSDFTIPNETTQPATSYANNSVFGRLFKSSEDTGWTYGPNTQVPYNNGELISNADIVFWYEAYLAHSAAEGSSLWHSTGLRIMVGADTTPPTVPGSLSATAAGSSHINLSWTASTDTFGVTGYQVERCQGVGCSTFAPVTTVPGTSFGDSGLTAVTSYSYRVRATDEAGNLSGYSTEATAVTLAPDTTPPTVPTGLTATAAGSSQINLSWTASTDTVGVTGYLLERCQGAGCSSFTQIATPAGTTYSDIGLLAGTTYGYRVRATDADGNLSGYSTPASATTAAAPVVISFRQGASAVPQTPQTTVAVAFTAAQTAGNLNVVVVGWNDSSAIVSSVTDTRGNVYTRAVGPTQVAGALSQSIYYAKNIVAAGAGANAVTVRFDRPAVYADIRVLEYSGLDPVNPVDGTATGTGSGTTSSTAAVTTTNANDLLVAANVVQTFTSGPGAGFTNRMVTVPDGDIVEDRVVSATGSYSATASLSSAGAWVMQLVAFRAAGGAPPPDTTPPTVTVNQAGTQADPTSSTPINFTVVFNEAVTGFATGDVTLGGTATGTLTGTVTEIAPLNGTTYQVAVSGMTGSGTVTASLNAGVATDTAGNGTAASTSADNTVTFDSAAPTVASINRATASPTNLASVNFTVTFSESVTGVATGDFALTTTGVTGSTISSVSGGPSVYTVSFNTGTGSGTIRLDIPATATITDLVNNALAGLPFTTGQSYTIDKAAPTVTVNQAGTQADPTNSAPINFTVVFNEAVTGFATGDVTLGGTATGTLTGTVTEIAPLNGTTYQVAVSGMTGSGTVTASIGIGVATDTAGNGTAASTSTDNTVTFGSAAPTVASINRATASPTNAASVQWTVTFSKSVSGVDAGDFVLAPTGVMGAAISSVSGGPSVYTISANTGTGSGTLGLNLVDNDSIIDAASNPLGGAGAGNGNFTGQVYTIDKTAPTVPGSLSATAAGSTQINLNWTVSTDTVGVTGYLVERCQGAGCSSFSQIATPTGTTYSNTGLQASTSYSYRVRATDAAGNLSGYSTPASATTAAAAPAVISFRQGKYATPQTPQATVAVIFTAAQTAGNLNVVVVGWNDSSAIVSSVTDTRGNVYTRAVGPTQVAGALSQSIYYAKNIVAAGAGANAVTVRFDRPAVYADIRVLEYSGLDPVNPVDGTATGTGSGTTSSTAAVTTTNANDLLVAANVVQTFTSGPGAGFTNRMVTVPDGDIVEDRVVSATGSYSATASLSSAGAWVMQLVAFRAAGSP